jgi:trk system potassium uptake protein TrkH
MNLSLVARLLAGFTLFFTGLTVVPLVVAFFEPASAFQTVRGFAWAASLGSVTALALRLLGREAEPEFFRREGLAVVGLAWVMAGVLGGVPLYASGSLGDFADAFFESISGLTTTGATVYNTAQNPAPEDLPSSILLWRSMLQWVGGTGVILVFTVLLPTLGLTGKNLLDSEAVGVSRQDQKPRVREQSRLLFRLYVSLTALCALGYWLAGMGGFDAVCHALTTLATGGFSTQNYSLGQYQNLGIELCSILFMFLAGTSFLLMLSAARGRDIRILHRNPEFRAYTILTVVLIAFVTLALRFWGRSITDPGLELTKDYTHLGTCLRDAAFQVVSILTSTGYGSTDFQNWPKIALFALVACMLIGGSTGSTAGGFKVYRVLVCLKLIGFAMRRFIRPRTVEKLRVGEELVPNGAISTILTLLILWFGSVAAGGCRRFKLRSGPPEPHHHDDPPLASARQPAAAGPASRAIFPNPHHQPGIFFLNGGTGSFPMGFPSSPTFLGASVYVQAAPVAPGINPFNRITSNGLQLTLGEL